MRKSLVTALAIACCAALVAGCTSTAGKGGGPSKHRSSAPRGPGNATIAPRDLRGKVGAAMRSAKTFHVVAKGGEAGKRMSFDIHFAPHKAAGWINENGEKFELINPGGASLYFRLSRTTWQRRAGEQAAELFSGRWVKVPAKDKSFAGFAHDFDAKLFTGLTSDMTKGMKKVGPATVRGVRATEYKSASDHSRLFIARYGPPVVLKAVDPSRDGGTISFSDYGKSYRFRPPPAAQVIDSTKLEAGN